MYDLEKKEIKVQLIEPDSEIFLWISPTCLFQRDISINMNASTFIREMVLNDFAIEVIRCTERTDNFCCRPTSLYCLHDEWRRG